MRSYRSSKSRGMQARETPSYQRVELDFSLATHLEDLDFTVAPSPELQLSYHKPEEEIELGPACFLWDYVRRSRQAGFFIPLSGGVDSCATSCIVFSMCKLVYAEIQKGDNPEVLKDLLRIVGEPDDSQWRPHTPQDVAGRLFVSAYMGMAKNSSANTRNRARELAESIGSYESLFTLVQHVYVCMRAETASLVMQLPLAARGTQQRHCFGRRTY